MSIAEKLVTIKENEQKVYEAGKQEAVNDIWKVLSTLYDGKTRDYYNYCFKNCNFSFIDGFNPPFAIKPKYADYMFESASYMGTITKEKLDTSALVSASYMFRYSGYMRDDWCELEEFCANKMSNVNNVFCYFYRLKRIGKLILKEDGTQNFTNTFLRSDNLTDIDSIEGVIGTNISFPNSTLTPNTMKNIINALADYSTENTLTYTVTFKSECWEALEADSTAPDGGTWKDYVYNVKGWNY